MSTATHTISDLAPEISAFCDRAVLALREKLPVCEVWLFGSQATGDAQWDSDVDLLVVLSDDHGLSRPGLECFRVVSDLHDRPAVDVAAIDMTKWRDERYRSFGLWHDVVEKGIQLL